MHEHSGTCENLVTLGSELRCADRCNPATCATSERVWRIEPDETVGGRCTYRALVRREHLVVFSASSCFMRAHRSARTVFLWATVADELTAIRGLISFFGIPWSCGVRPNTPPTPAGAGGPCRLPDGAQRRAWGGVSTRQGAVLRDGRCPGTCSCSGAGQVRAASLDREQPIHLDFPEPLVRWLRIGFEGLHVRGGMRQIFSFWRSGHCWERWNGFLTSRTVLRRQARFRPTNLGTVIQFRADTQFECFRAFPCLACLRVVFLAGWRSLRIVVCFVTSTAPKVRGDLTKPTASRSHQFTLSSRLTNS